MTVSNVKQVHVEKEDLPYLRERNFIQILTYLGIPLQFITTQMTYMYMYMYVYVLHTCPW